MKGAGLTHFIFQDAVNNTSIEHKEHQMDIPHPLENGYNALNTP